MGLILILNQIMDQLRLSHQFIVTVWLLSSLPGVVGFVVSNFAFYIFLTSTVTATYSLGQQLSVT